MADKRVNDHSYGQVGRAIYDQKAKKWGFGRQASISMYYLDHQIYSYLRPQSTSFVKLGRSERLFLLHRNNPLATRTGQAAPSALEFLAFHSNIQK